MADLECPTYFDLDCDIGLSTNIPIVLIPGVDVYWNYFRQEVTLELSKTEATLHDLPKNVVFRLSNSDRTFNKLRRQVTFYKDFIMANRDPFEVSKGGKLVSQRIFLDPLRLRGDEIDGTPTSTQSEADFVVDNIQVNAVDIVNEDGITFPAGTVISFDCEAPGSLGIDLTYDTALLYFNFQSLAGLDLTISHPIRVVDALEVQ